MFMKKSSVPLADRARQSQQRSRARRKQLIHELNERIRSFEQQEIRASSAMQRAAKKVLWENTQLRDLLVSKGVTSEEISKYLSDHQSEGAISKSKTNDDKEEPLGHVPGDDTPKPKSTGCTMSCENAASIIAGMRGHSEDDEIVRSRLGCSSLQTCEVKNMRVLQVMEME
jgi:hypothetical protein